MNLVANMGQGESVGWLGFIMTIINAAVSQLAIKLTSSSLLKNACNKPRLLRQNIEENAWRLEWYQRAWFDETPLGSPVMRCVRLIRSVKLSYYPKR